jgi:hypothetical protein
MKTKNILRVATAIILSLGLLFSVMPDSRGLLGEGIVSAAGYSAGTEAELLLAIADAPSGSEITVTSEIALASPLTWNNKTLTLKGAGDSAGLLRGEGLGGQPMIIVGGTDGAVAAGLIVLDLVIDDAGGSAGAPYDGIVCAYSQGATITLGSGARLVNSGGGSGVYLGGAAAAGPELTMLDGSSVLYGNSGTGASGAGVYAGEHSRFAMEGGIIQGNRTTGEGGGVYVDSGATFVMDGGLVKGNTASAGGGVLVSGNGEGGAFVMKGGSVTGNILSGSGAPVGTPANRHGEDVAVGAPSGASPARGGTAPSYGDAAYSAEIYPDAEVGAGKVGVQNEYYDQAVYMPESRVAPVLVGALKQHADTVVQDSLSASAAAQLPTAQGLTYAGNALYAPDRNSGTVVFRLNYPDEIPAYDSAGMNVRNRYCYALVYAALDADGNAIGPASLIAPVRDYANLIAELPAVSGAASYGIAKYYYDKSGALDVDIAAPAGGSLVEKQSGLGGTLHFDSVPSGAALVPSPAAYTLIATPDAGWHLESVALTAGDGYVTEKQTDANGELTLYYTDLAAGANRLEAVFAMDDGTISISMPDASFVYDGRPHRVPVTGLAKGDEVQYMYRVGASGFITAHENPAFTDVNKVVSDSVLGGVDGEEIIVYVTVTRGAVSARASASLTISPRQLTVKPADSTKEYDGSPLRADSVEMVTGALVQGHRLDLSSAVFGGSRTAVGGAPSTVSGVSINGTNPDNYAISYAPGWISVTKAYGGSGASDSLTPGSDGSGGGSENTGEGGSGSGAGTGSGTGSGDSGNTGEENNNNNGISDEEDAADGGTASDGGTEDGTEISPEEPPKAADTTGDTDKDKKKPKGYHAWWLLIVLAVAAAAFMWCFMPRRRKDGENGYSDNSHDDRG